MSGTTLALDAITDAVVAAFPDLDQTGQRLAVTLYRTLAEGRPVSLATLAQRCAVSESGVADTLASWPGVFRDAGGSVVGFAGLSLGEMAFSYTVGGRQLYTWCAWDTLFITPILGQVAEVAATCPVTGEVISLTVGPEGVRNVDPAGAVVSFLSPTQQWADDVITTFCHYVLLFSSRQAGERWVGEHPGTFLLTLADAFELGRRLDLSRFGIEAQSAEGPG